MTIDKIFKELERRVSKGEVTFIQKAVTAVAGNVNFWIETVHPVFDLSPLWYLAEKGFLPEPPPYGLSWDDYNLVVDACFGHKGEEDHLRLKLIESCKAIRKVNFLDE